MSQATGLRGAAPRRQRLSRAPSGPWLGLSRSSQRGGPARRAVQSGSSARVLGRRLGARGVPAPVTARRDLPGARHKGGHRCRASALSCRANITSSSAPSTAQLPCACRKDPQKNRGKGADSKAGGGSSLLGVGRAPSRPSLILNLEAVLSICGSWGVDSSPLPRARPRSRGAGVRHPEPPARVSGAGLEDRGPARGAGRRRGDLSRGGSRRRARMGASGVQPGAGVVGGAREGASAGSWQASRVPAGWWTGPGRLAAAFPKEAAKGQTVSLEGTGPGSGGRTSAGHWTRASRSEIWAGALPSPQRPPRPPHFPVPRARAPSRALRSLPRSPRSLDLLLLC